MAGVLKTIGLGLVVATLLGGVGWGSEIVDRSDQEPPSEAYVKSLFPQFWGDLQAKGVTNIRFERHRTDVLSSALPASFIRAEVWNNFTMYFTIGDTELSFRFIDIDVDVSDPNTSADDLDREVVYFGGQKFLQDDEFDEEYSALDAWLLGRDLSRFVIVPTLTNNAETVERYNITIDDIKKVVEEYAVYRQQASTPSTATRSATSLMMRETILPPMKPAAFRAPALPQTRRYPDGTDADAFALANIPVHPMTLDVTGSSALRYEKTWFRDADVESDRVGASIRAGWDFDAITLDFVVPVDRVWFDGSLDELDYTRAGIMATPRAHLAREGDGSPFDLSVGLNLFYFHTFMDTQNSYVRMLVLMGAREVEREDPDHVGIGPFLSVHKTFDHFAIGAGAVWQQGFNIDGNTDFVHKGGPKDKIDMIQAGANIGVPIGDNFVINGSASYTHTPDLPDDVDADYFTVGLGATYLLKGKWALDLTLQRNIGYSHADNIEAHIGMSWMF